jgi:myo-inositol-1(or 4)-monophosphatase
VSEDSTAWVRQAGARKGNNADGLFEADSISGQEAVTLQTELDLTQVLARIKQVVLAVGAIQKENLGRQNLKIATKSTGIDLVTEIDQKSEQTIIACLQEYFPGHSILAEESGLTAHASEYTWVIDPLDGTTNYAQGLPIFAISIALRYRKETVLAVVYAPVVEQLYTAIKGQGAYLNGEKLHVAAKTKLIDCVLATGFPYDIATHPANNIRYFSHIVTQARAVRRLGAAAYDLACVAAGTFDGYWEMNLSPWDAAAGILLVEEAGGQVVHFRQDRGVSIIAANPVICRELEIQIQKIELIIE